MRQSCSSTFILDCFKCMCLYCFFLFFFCFFCVFFCVFFHSHEKDTTLPRQKRKPATHRTPHCHVRKEPLPRTGDHTATSERNYCHIRQIEKKTKEHKKKTQETPKKTKQKKTHTHTKKNKTKPKKKFETSEMHVAEKLWNWGMSNFKGWSVFHGRGTC